MSEESKREEGDLHGSIKWIPIGVDFRRISVGTDMHSSFRRLAG